MLQSFHLQNDPELYTYTKEGAATTVSESFLQISFDWRSTTLFNLPFVLQTSNNDRSSHRAVMKALEVIGFSEEEISSIYQILAAILLLVLEFTQTQFRSEKV